MTATRAIGAFGRLVVALLALAVSAAHADDRVQLIATTEAGYGRLVLNFPDRLDLPPYEVRYENGVVAIEFNEAIEAVLPDVSGLLPDYVSIARIDPDRKGIRFGLRRTLNLNRIEAG